MASKKQKTKQTKSAPATEVSTAKPKANTKPEDKMQDLNKFNEPQETGDEQTPETPAPGVEAQGTEDKARGANATVQTVDDAPEQPAPVAEETQEQDEPSVQAEEEAAAEKPAEESWEEKLFRIKRDGSMSERNVIQFMEKYVKDMAPGHVTSLEDSLAYQMGLWRLVRGVIESRQDFEGAYKLLIAYAAQYKDTVFADSNLYKGMERISLDKETAKYFQASLNVITIAAGVKNRKDVAKQTDLNRVMSGKAFTEVGRNNILNFFTA